MNRIKNELNINNVAVVAVVAVVVIVYASDQPQTTEFD